jgi:hypothetical protein
MVERPLLNERLRKGRVEVKEKKKWPEGCPDRRGYLFEAPLKELVTFSR